MTSTGNNLILALKHRQPEKALDLIEMGEDVNGLDEDGSSALMLAAQYEKIFLLIVERNPEVWHVNKDGETVLHSIAYSGTVGELNALDQRGIPPGEIDRQDDEGNPPLFCAVSNLPVFEALLSLGADINLKNGKGYSLLHQIAYLGSIHELELVHPRLPDLNCQEQGGNTPLHVAVEFGDYKLAEALITRGADVNARNYGGETPLHYTISSNIMAHELEHYIKTMRVLIEAGADFQAVTGKGETPLQLSEQYFQNSPHTAIKSVLLEYGAK